MGFPFTLKRRLPAPRPSRGERFHPEVHGATYDDVILRNARLDRPKFTAAHPAWRRADREGAFTLYERMR